MKYLSILAVVALVSGHAFAQQPGAASEKALSEARQDLQDRAQLERQIANAVAPIKSLSDFYNHLHDGSKGMSAFAKLPAKSQNAFINSLTFNEKGLTGFDSRVLEDSLRVEEAYNLLSMFGVQSTVRFMRGLRAENSTDLLIRQAVSQPRQAVGKMPNAGPASPNYIGGGLVDDHDNYQCVSRATCESSGGRICTSNC